jgi:hypothetical protein
MDYQEILTIIATAIATIFGGGASVRFFKQKKNGGTTLDYNKRIYKKLEDIDRRLQRVEVKIAVQEDRCKREKKK